MPMINKATVIIFGGVGAVIGFFKLGIPGIVGGLVVGLVVLFVVALLFGMLGIGKRE